VIRCDNGPENVSGAIQNWAEEAGIAFQYIQPGKPQQNAYVERFNRTVRYEWLSQHYWQELDEVRHHATQWPGRCVQTWCLATPHPNSDWPWPLNVHFRSHKKEGLPYVELIYFKDNI
jgi:transposase InsO family protein